MKDYEVISISSDTEVKVAVGIAISSQLTGRGTDFSVEMKKKDGTKKITVPVSCISGAFDTVRPHLHALLDEWLDAYQYPKSDA